MWAIPFSTLVGSSVYFLRKSRIEWSIVAPPLLCLSLITSSYGWAYDQSLLVLCQILAVCKVFAEDSPRQRRLAIAMGLLATQGLAFYLGTRSDNAQHYYVWLPWALLLLTLFANHSAETREETR